MIAPSDEDSFTFTVSAANGDIFKLRGKFKLASHLPCKRCKENSERNQNHKNLTI